jgi:ABC-type uncharacterized transport system auxiliary subunit
MIRLFLISIVVGLLNSCSSLFGPPTQRPTVSYEIADLTWGGNSSCARAQNSQILYISPMRSNSLYDSLKMYYTNQPYELNSFGYSEWAALPTEMLIQAIMKRTYTACIFSNVVTSNALADAKYRLITQLVNLRQEINDNQTDAVVKLTIFAQLVDLNKNSVIASKAFIQQGHTAVGPVGMVTGVNQLLVKLDDELILWLRKNAVTP